MRVLFVVGDLDSPTGSCVKAVAHDLVERGNYVKILAEKYYNRNIDFCDAESVLNNSYTYLNSKKYFLRALILCCHRIKAMLYSPIWPFFSIKKPLILLKRSSDIIKKDSIDTVVAVHYGINSVYVGHKLKIKNSLTFIAYFLDGCYAGPCPRYLPLWLKDKMALKWESELLSNSDGVVMMKSAEKKYNFNKQNISYYSKISFLDIPLYLPRKVKSSVERIFFPKEQKVILFAGTMLRNIRPPHYFLRLFSKLQESNLHLYIAGLSDYQNLILEMCKQNKNIHYLGQLESQRLNIMLTETDFLLNIGNSVSGMVPSKIFEYMSYCKPIIATYRIEEDSSIPYLKDYSMSLLIDERRDISDNLEKLSRFVGRKVGSIGFKLEQFYENTPECFSHYLEKKSKERFAKS